MGLFLSVCLCGFGWLLKKKKDCQDSLLFREHWPFRATIGKEKAAILPLYDRNSIYIAYLP
jgi:hypothetical protein